MKKNILSFLLIAVLASSNLYAANNEKTFPTTEKISSLLSKEGLTDLNSENLLTLVKKNKITIKEIYDSKENDICVMANSFSNEYDSDNDGLSDADEIFKYFTNPNDNDSDDDGIIDGDWKERKEFSYNLTLTVRLLNLYTIEDMQTEYQDSKIINKTEQYTDFEIVLYPYHKYFEKIYIGNSICVTKPENTKPTAIYNYDEAIQKEIKNNVSFNGNDYLYVQNVAKYAISQAKKQCFAYGYNMFLKLENDEISLLNTPFLQKQFSTILPGKDQKYILENSVLYKQMFNSKTCSEAFSYNTLVTGSLRAAGIPTKTNLKVPFANGIDSKQIKLLDNITDDALRKSLKQSLDVKRLNLTITQEVYIGNRWIECRGYGIGNMPLDLINVKTVNSYDELINDLSNVYYTPIYEKQIKDFTTCPYQLLSLYENKKEAK